ncbi:hypothetical protein [Bacillus sp. EB600]|uniref:hypothetical protein n=1 Tax=Bacillus sp. EB600 TaxID=2806345 RepID=UPI0028122BCF|nr:hypothetical protein [Bacillus sp. EB600]
MGIPEEKADRYEGYVKESKILVVVECRENSVGDGHFDANLTDGTMTANDPTNTPVHFRSSS